MTRQRKTALTTERKDPTTLEEDAENGNRVVKNRAKRDNTNPGTKKKNPKKRTPDSKQKTKTAVAHTPPQKPEISVMRKSNNLKTKGSSWWANPNPKPKIPNNSDRPTTNNTAERMPPKTPTNDQINQRNP
jgi:hypothetical protein